MFSDKLESYDCNSNRIWNHMTATVIEPGIMTATVSESGII